MKNCFKDSDTYPSFFPPNKAWQSSHKHKWYCTSWSQLLNTSCNAKFVLGIVGLRLIHEIVTDFEISLLYRLDRVTTTLCFHFFFLLIDFPFDFFLPIRHDRMILVSEKGWWFIKSKQHLLLLLFHYNLNAVRCIKNNQQLA